MSDAMANLAAALSTNEVPGRNPFHQTSWEKFAWPSNRSLHGWFADMEKRADQLVDWSALFTKPKVPGGHLPFSLWLPGLFNPMAFITAVMQVTARRSGQALDNMTTETHMTAMMQPSEAEK